MKKQISFILALILFCQSGTLFCMKAKKEKKEFWIEDIFKDLASCSYIKKQRKSYRRNLEYLQSKKKYRLYTFDSDYRELFINEDATCQRDYIHAKKILKLLFGTEQESQEVADYLIAKDKKTKRAECCGRMIAVTFVMVIACGLFYRIATFFSDYIN